VKGEFMSTYNDKFGSYSVDQKRKDLMINPFFNSDKIKDAPDEDVISIHEQYFTAMNNAMEKVLGESMFDDEW
jgi:hypothetical protein